MRRQDTKTFLAAAAVLAFAACGGAATRSGPGAPVSAQVVPAPAPSASPTPSASPASAGGCYAASDCAPHELCVDPRYPQCGAVPACEEMGQIRCGCTCVAIGAGAEGCAADEVRGASGCCEPRPCAADGSCGVPGDRCLAGRCVRAGTCAPPAP